MNEKELKNKFWGRVNGQVNGQVGTPVNMHFWPRINDQTNSQVYNRVFRRVGSPFGNQLAEDLKNKT